MSIDKKIDYVNQDGYKNYIKNSKSVTVPVKFKSKKDATPTKLAYITADEAKMLKKMKKNTPHKGPSGIPSYDDYDASKGDYGTATSGEQMSGFEGGAKGERSRADARSLGMSPKDVQDIRGGALKAGAGQVTNPSFFGPRNRPGVNVKRGSGLGNLGRSIFSGILGLINPVAGLFARGINFLSDKAQDLRGYNPDGTPRTQEEYEAAMKSQQLTTRLDNLYDRKFSGKKKKKKNIDMLEAMGVTTSKGNIKSAIDRDIINEPEMPLFSKTYIQSLAQPKVNTVVPQATPSIKEGIETIDVGFDDPAFNNQLMADASYDQQKNVLENILNTEDTGVGEFIEDKEQKDKRQQQLLNEIMTG